jgi:uncharacterized membrane protein (DUF485 family)
MASMTSFSRDNDIPDDDRSGPDFAAIHRSEQFIELRRTLLRFVIPATALFLGWYLTYVILAAYAPGLMAVKVTGNVTVGLLLGLSQFLSTALITVSYARFARRRVDPAARRLRDGR